MAVRGIDDDHIDTGFGQQLGTLLGAGTDADGCTDQQTAVCVLGGIRMFGRFEDVLDGNQATQLEGIVDDQHALQAVLVHQRLGFLGAAALLHRDQAFARRHDAGHRLVEVRLETQIAIGDDADDGLAFEYRQTGNPVRTGQREHFAYRHRRHDGDRILEHAGFEALDLGHFGRLRLRLQILVHDADTTFLSQRNRKAGFGDGIHRCGYQRQVQ